MNALWVSNTLAGKVTYRAFCEPRSLRRPLPRPPRAARIGGKLFNTAITRPRAFDSSQKYPVLVKVYGGPSAQMVLDYRDGYVLSCTRTRASSSCEPTTEGRRIAAARGSERS